MSDIPGYDIRYSVLEDLSYLESWFTDPAESVPFPFTFEEKEMPLKNWIGFSRYKASLTGTIDQIPCAIGTLFLMPYRKVAHHCGFYLMVDPLHRRKGVGASMVKNLLHLAKTRFRLEAVHAEVFEPNPILPLLEKLSFVPFARQENFENVEGDYRARVLLEHFFQ